MDNVKNVRFLSIIPVNVLTFLRKILHYALNVLKQPVVSVLIVQDISILQANVYLA
jgi:hypothetical protein